MGRGTLFQTAPVQLFGVHQDESQKSKHQLLVCKEDRAEYSPIPVADRDITVSVLNKKKKKKKKCAFTFHNQIEKEESFFPLSIPAYFQLPSHV